MEVKGKKIGFIMTGSFCTFSKTIPIMKKLIEKNAEVIPIMSFNAYNVDTRFGKADNIVNQIQEITGKEVIHTITDAEPIGPKKMTDIIVIVPCSRKYYLKISV